MLPEDLLLVLVVAVGVVLGIAGWPIYRRAKAGRWRQNDPLAEAEERLRLARLEAEVARVNRETEEVYDRMYQDVLDDGKGRGLQGSDPLADSDPPADSAENAKKGKQ